MGGWRRRRQALGRRIDLQATRAGHRSTSVEQIDDPLAGALRTFVAERSQRHGQLRHVGVAPDNELLEALLNYLDELGGDIETQIRQ